jgi:hypothetical protein
MKLIDNWKEIARDAYSMRWLYLLSIVAGIEVALPFFLSGFMVPPIWSGLLTLVIAIAAMVGRITYQSHLTRPKPQVEEEPWV